jgi:hypothetical protein
MDFRGHSRTRKRKKNMLRPCAQNVPSINVYPTTDFNVSLANIIHGGKQVIA